VNFFNLSAGGCLIAASDDDNNGNGDDDNNDDNNGDDICLKTITTYESKKTRPQISQEGMCKETYLI
jgi:hypothetical protein